MCRKRVALPVVIAVVPSSGPTDRSAFVTGTCTSRCGRQVLRRTVPNPSPAAKQRGHDDPKHGRQVPTISAVRLVNAACILY